MLRASGWGTGKPSAFLCLYTDCLWPNPTPIYDHQHPTFLLQHAATHALLVLVSFPHTTIVGQANEKFKALELVGHRGLTA